MSSSESGIDDDEYLPMREYEVIKLPKVKKEIIAIFLIILVIFAMTAVGFYMLGYNYAIGHMVFDCQSQLNFLLYKYGCLNAPIPFTAPFNNFSIYNSSIYK